MVRVRVTPERRARAWEALGVGALSAGVWELAGTGWALIVAGALGIVHGLLLVDVDEAEPKQ